MAGSQPNHTYN